MTKEEYFSKMHTQLVVWQRKLDKLESSVQNAKNSVKEQNQKKVIELKQKIDRTSEKLDHAQKSSFEAFDEIKNGMQNSFDEIKDGFEAAYKEIHK